MASYYDSNKATSANSRFFILDGSDQQHFPFEGLYIGELSAKSIVIGSTMKQRCRSCGGMSPIILLTK